MKYAAMVWQAYMAFLEFYQGNIVRALIDWTDITSSKDDLRADTALQHTVPAVPAVVPAVEIKSTFYAPRKIMLI